MMSRVSGCRHAAHPDCHLQHRAGIDRQRQVRQIRPAFTLSSTGYNAILVSTISVTIPLRERKTPERALYLGSARVQLMAATHPLTGATKRYNVACRRHQA